MIPRRVQLCAVTLLCLVASGTTYAEACRSESFKGAPYIVCTFDPAKDDLRIYWRGDDSKPYRTFAALAGDLEGKDKSLQFAMNGGMYQDDFRPVGLYIENGREKAGVLDTGRFLAHRPEANFATQSGPTLVIDGAINPAFIVDSNDRKPRNGVGVSSKLNSR